MKRRVFMGLPMAFSIAAMAMFLNTALAADVSRITKEELKSRIGDSDIVVLDVRRSGDWKASPSKIQGAVREDPADVDSWAAKYPKETTLVLYCA
jgi:rhodanese-related sulfurtransferase